MKFKPRRLYSIKNTLCALALCLSVLALAGKAQNSPNPLSKNDVLNLLNHGVPSARVAVLAQQNKIDFQIDANTEAELLRAGATPELIESLRHLAPPQPTVLVLHSTPGGAKVYIDDEPIGTTSDAGRLKLSTIAPGQHRIRLSLDGYRDAYRSTDVLRGQETDVDVTLESAKPVTPTPDNNNVSSHSAAPADPATIYFYRLANLNHAIIPAHLYCDGVSLGKLPNGRYFSITLPPVKHVCRSTSSTRVELDLASASSYYINVSMIAGIPVKGSVSLVPAANAASELAKLSPCGTSSGPDGNQVSGCGQ